MQAAAERGATPGVHVPRPGTLLRGGGYPEPFGNRSQGQGNDAGRERVNGETGLASLVVGSDVDAFQQVAHLEKRLMPAFRHRRRRDRPFKRIEPDRQARG